jgi:8-oxo-dGTP pyrophosphatase MutT (NUDIX family)
LKKTEILLPENLAEQGKFICYAAAAMLVSEEGDYLLQQRDSTPGVWYPNMLCFFGGGIDSYEDAEAALCRELMEELEFNPQKLTYFSFFYYDTPGFGSGGSCRYIYESQVTKYDMAQMTQHEGAGMKLLSPDDVLSREHPIVPGDLQMLYAHLMRRGLVPQPTE